MTKISSDKSHWILFLFSPFFAAIFAAKKYRTTWAKNIIWAFVTFYGFTFVIGSESRESDINRYMEQLHGLYGRDLNFAQAVDVFRESGEVDVVRTIIAIIVSRFTNSQQILTGIYGFIFGFFFSRNIWFLLTRLKGNLKSASLILLLVFLLINPFWNINGFRFWTATQIFLYGLLPLIYEGKKKSIWACFFSLMVHFSFLFPIVILCVYLIFGKRVNIFFIFFLISIFFSEVKIEIVNNFVDTYLPASFAERSANYRDSRKVLLYRTLGAIDKSWYAVWYLKLLYWSLMIFIIVLYFKYRKLLQKHPGLLRLFSFTLLFFGFANIMSSLPSGGRFLSLAALCALFIIIYCIQNIPKMVFLNKLVLLTFPFLLLFIIVSMRTGFYTLNLSTIISDPLIVLFFNYNISLNDLIK